MCSEEGAVNEFVEQVRKESESINGDRYLLLWPIEEGTDYSNLYTFVNSLAAAASENKILASYPVMYNSDS